MCDTNDHTLEKRIVAIFWIHEHPQTGKSMRKVQDNFQQRFRKKPPPKQTLLRRERKLFQIGSVKDTPKIRRHMKVELKLYPYRPRFVHELSDDDSNC